jgi:hypothetical protein
MLFLRVVVCYALLAVATAEPKVVGLSFKKEAHPESLKARSEAAHALIQGRGTVDVTLGNVSTVGTSQIRL